MDPPQRSRCWIPFSDCTTMWARRSGNRFHFARIRFPTNHERSVRRKPIGQSISLKTMAVIFTSNRSTTFALLPCRTQHSALDRPDPSRGGLLLGLTISGFTMIGSSYLSRMAWSSHRLKRSVSASLAGEVSMMSEGLAECKWIRGVLESAVCRDYDPSLHRRRSVQLPTVYCQRH